MVSAADKWWVNNSIKYKGIPVAKGSDTLAIIGADGQLISIRERNLPLRVDATEPSVDQQAAISVCEQHFKGISEETLSEISEVSLEIWVDEKRNGYLTYTFTLKSSSEVEPQAIRYWVSAVNKAKIISWESLIYKDHSGTVTGMIWETSPFGSKSDNPLAFMEVTRTGSGGGKASTNQNGKYVFSGTGNVKVSGNLQGDFSRIQNMAGSTMERTQGGDHNNPINLDFDAVTEFELAQVSAYYWTNVSHEFAKGILGNNLHKLPTRVNHNNTCNAYWNGSSINFFKGGPNCPNTAFSDVVLHEYGHGIDHVIGGILDGGYSEGFGDAMSILVTRQPCLGRDFKGQGTCLRDATDDIKWPPANPEVHYVGRIYGGFTWELIQELLKNNPEDTAYEIAKQLILGAAAGNPKDIPDAIKLSFVADDNDSDLSNGTPHCSEIVAAAESRNIPIPDELNCGNGPKGGCCAAGASAQFSLTENKKVSTNTNILIAKIHLDREMDVHIQANTSARSLTGPLYFRTGFYNQQNPNTVWTGSYRNVNTPQVNQSVNFGSNYSIRLGPGDHTIYWKIWVSGGTLAFSSGTMLIEAFTPIGDFGLALWGAETSTLELFEELPTFTDESGHDVIRAGN